MADIQTIADQLKKVEARVLPSGLTSTKFLAIVGAVIGGVMLLKGNSAAIMDLIKWGVTLYVVQRLVEGGLHLICDTVLKVVAVLATAKRPDSYSMGDEPKKAG